MKVCYNKLYYLCTEIEFELTPLNIKYNLSNYYRIAGADNHDNLGDPLSLNITASAANTDILSALRQLEAKFEIVSNVQENLLTQVLNLREDVKLLVSGSKQEVFRVKEGLPTHPIENLEHLSSFEEWIASGENYCTIVSIFYS
jgi:DNA/RNA-binding domain of Phe-tRNA-synthetase-like protein